MNHQLWSEHLTSRIAELEAELSRVRDGRRRQHARAEYWSARAIDAATQLRTLRAPAARPLSRRYPKVSP